MVFVRNKDIKEVLQLGIAKDIPKWMNNNQWGYSHKDYIEVWKWAMEHRFHKKERRKLIFDFIVGRNKTRWYDQIIDVSGYNNELLWLSIDNQEETAVRALLSISGLFEKETLNLKNGVSKLNGQFTERGDKKLQLMGTNLGAHIFLAEQNGCLNIKEMLINYYNNEIQKG
jgi:hypothetical protein